MTLSDLASIGSLVSGIAVTASLIYLALQTHQNAKHTRALIHQGRIAGIREIAVAATDADVVSAIILANGGTPTPRDVKRMQFQFFFAATLYGWQDSFSQHESGLLDSDIYLQMRSAVTSAMAQPGSRAMWEGTLRVPGTKFAAFVDGIIAALPPPAAGGREPGAHALTQDRRES